MKKRRGIIVVIIIAVIALVILGLSLSTKGTQRMESMVNDYLIAHGVEISETKDIIVKKSIKSSLLFSDEWTISVEYNDEPGIYYMYFYKDGKIEFTGIAGSESKDMSEYTHYPVGKSVPADLPPMIFAMSNLYKQSTSQSSYNELIDEFVYIGEIESLTDPLQKPNEDLQANHDIRCSRVYQYEENMVVLINGKYWLYEVFSE